jgi:hypothetical protein
MLVSIHLVLPGAMIKGLGCQLGHSQGTPLGEMLPIH